jgi:hypothetical protein
LYRSELITASFDAATDKAAAGAEYMNRLTAYLDANPGDVDGLWAVAQGKFLIASLGQPIANRFELWAALPGEREKLGRIAGLADRCLMLARAQLKAAMTATEAVKPFDDKRYTQFYAGYMEAGYDRAFALYFRALALDSGDKKQPEAQVEALIKERADLLTQAIAAVSEWADGDEKNGVKPQSLLLRGKAHSELLQGDLAVADLRAAAEHAGTADWIKYQGQYQTVVARLNQGNLAAAQDEFLAFSNRVAAQGTGTPAAAAALAGVEILHFRLAWAQAAALPEAGRAAARAAALAILSRVMERDPLFRELILEQVAAGAGATAVKDLLPLQQVAVAWSAAQKLPAEGGSARAYAMGVEAAQAVIGNAAASKQEKAEAMIVAGVCYSRLSKPAEAARMNLEFAQAAPDDARARQVVEVALGQIGELRRAGTLTPEMSKLADDALALATEKYGEKRWLYARGILLQEQSKPKEAAAAFEQVPADDENYIDARYRLVVIKLNALNEMTNAKAAQGELVTAGRDLVARCTALADLLAKTTAGMREARKSYVVDLRLVQAGTLISPLGDAAGALQALDLLDQQTPEMKLVITPATQEALWRDRILALQMTGKGAEALTVLDRLRGQSKEKGLVMEQGLAARNVEEIGRIEASEPDRAKTMAAATVGLLERLIADTTAADDLYRYKQLQADMLTRAGRPQAAAKVWRDLQGISAAEVTAGKRKEDDLLNHIGEARALQADSQFSEARKRLNEMLPNVEPGSEAYWEVYLRIFQCLEAEGADKEVIHKPLHDLHAAYGAAVGGKRFKAEYEDLAKRYDP